MRDIDPTASEFITSGYLKNSRVGGLMYDPATIATSVAPQLIGGLMGGGSDAPQRGADQQVQANNAAIAETRAARDQQRADLAPWMQSGGGANNELMRRLGVGGNGRIGSYTPTSREALRAQMAGRFTTPGTQSPSGGSSDEYGNVYYSGGATPAVVDQNGLNSAVESAFNAQGPAREGEIDPEYGSLLKAAPAATPAPAYKQFSQDDLSNDLVYQNGLKFGLDTGTNQINDRAASGGNYGSGAALKALTRFGNDYGTTKTAGAYDRNLGQQTDLYNRHQTQQNDLYNRNMAGKNQIFNFLSGPSQQGQSAAAGVGAAGLSSAGAIGGYQAGNGNALSAGTIGSANAVNQQVGGVTDAFRWNQMLGRNKPSSSYNPGPKTWGNGNAFSDTGDY